MAHRIWIAILVLLVHAFEATWLVEAGDGTRPAAGLPGISTPARQPTTSSLVGVWEENLEEWRDGSFIGLELVAVGRNSFGDEIVRRLRLPRTFWREERPHRKTKDRPRDAYWEACWRIVHRSPRGKLQTAGCIRKFVWANNVPERYEPIGDFLRFWWSFNVDTQEFDADYANVDNYLPYPTRLPSDRSWTGLKFHVPVPPWSLTPRDATRIIRERGGLVVGADETCDALLLPDWADYCGLDRRSCPKEPLPWLRKGIPVVWERVLRVADERHVVATPHVD